MHSKPQHVFREPKNQRAGPGRALLNLKEIGTTFSSGTVAGQHLLTLPPCFEELASRAELMMIPRECY